MSICNSEANFKPFYGISLVLLYSILLSFSFYTRMSDIDITTYKSTLPYSKHDLGTMIVKASEDNEPKWVPTLEMEHEIVLLVNQKEYPYDETYATQLGLDPEFIDHKEISPEMYRFLTLISVCNIYFIPSLSLN